MICKHLFPKFVTVMLIILASPFFIFAQSKDDVISVETNLVLLNAVVTDSNGSYVSGLQAKDFQVSEDNKLQKITVFGAGSTPFAAVILLDTSGSMEERMPLARSAAIKFLEGLRGEDSVAVYNFDSKVKIIQDFSSSRDLESVAFNLKADGMTVLNDAIVEASKILSGRTEKRRAIIILSDGADTKSKASQDKALKAAIASNSTIYTVDMSAFDGYSRERTQSVGALKSFADKSGGKFVPVSGGGELRDAFKKIIEELSVQYTIGYEPTNTAHDGKFRLITIKTTSPKPLQIRTRKGYNAPKN